MKYYVTTTWKHKNQIDIVKMENLLASYKGSNPSVLETIWFKIDDYTHGAVVTFTSEEDYLKHKHLHQKAREESSKSEEVTMIREEVGTQLAVLSEL